MCQGLWTGGTSVPGYKDWESYGKQIGLERPVGLSGWTKGGHSANPQPPCIVPPVEWQIFPASCLLLVFQSWHHRCRAGNFTVVYYTFFFPLVENMNASQQAPCNYPVTNLPFSSVCNSGYEIPQEAGAALGRTATEIIPKANITWERKWPQVRENIVWRRVWSFRWPLSLQLPHSKADYACRKVIQRGATTTSPLLPSRRLADSNGATLNCCYTRNPAFSVGELASPTDLVISSWCRPDVFFLKLPNGLCAAFSGEVLMQRFCSWICSKCGTSKEGCVHFQIP